MFHDWHTSRNTINRAGCPFLPHYFKMDSSARFDDSLDGAQKVSCFENKKMCDCSCMWLQNNIDLLMTDFMETQPPKQSVEPPKKRVKQPNTKSRSIEILRVSDCWKCVLNVCVCDCWMFQTPVVTKKSVHHPTMPQTEQQQSTEPPEQRTFVTPNLIINIRLCNHEWSNVVVFDNKLCCKLVVVGAKYTTLWDWESEKQWFRLRLYNKYSQLSK